MKVDLAGPLLRQDDLRMGVLDRSVVPDRLVQAHVENGNAVDEVILADVSPDVDRHANDRVEPPRDDDVVARGEGAEEAFALGVRAAAADLLARLELRVERGPAPK